METTRPRVSEQTLHPKFNVEPQGRVGGWVCGWAVVVTLTLWGGCGGGECSLIHAVNSTTKHVAGLCFIKSVMYALADAEIRHASCRLSLLLAVRYALRFLTWWTLAPIQCCSKCALSAMMLTVVFRRTPHDLHAGCSTRTTMHTECVRR